MSCSCSGGRSACQHQGKREAWMTRLYRVHHRGSRFRGRMLRLLIRPGKRPPNDGPAEGEVFVGPFRGLSGTSGR